MSDHWTASLGVAGVALGLHWLAGRAARRLAAEAARRRGRRPPLDLPPAFALALLAARAGIWALAVAVAASLVPAARAAAAMAGDVIAMGLRAPLFVTAERTWTTADVLAVPALLLVVWLATGAVARVVRAALLQPARVDRGVQEAVLTLGRIGLAFVGVVVVCQAWGVNLTSLAIAASVLGVGIGFGLQNIANNLVSGLLLAVERPVKPGDFVTLNGLSGTVERIGARSTEIRTPDRVSILVPNAKLLETELVNWSHGDPVSRIHVSIGVAYGTGLARARAALLEAARADPDVLADPRPEVELRAFGASALELDLEVWIREPRAQQRIRSRLNYRIATIFRRERIEMPFAQQTLHWPAGERLARAWTARHLPGADLGDADAADADDAMLDAALDPRRWSDATLMRVVAQMQEPGGVPLADRRHLLTVYRRCFVGRDATDWLVRHCELGRAEAVLVGERLVERGLVEHVLGEHGFRDGHFFFRFTARAEAAPTVEPERMVASGGR